MTNLGPWKVAMQRFVEQHNHPISTGNHPTARYLCYVDKDVPRNRIEIEMHIGGFRTIGSSRVPLNVLRSEIYVTMQPVIDMLLEDKSLSTQDTRLRLVSELNTVFPNGLRLGDAIMNKIIHEYPEYVL